MNGRSFNYWAIALAAASWGTWSVFLRSAEAERPLPPSLSTFVVLATVAVVLSPFALVERRRAPRRGGRDWLLLAAFGVSDALNCSLYFAALQSTSVTVATLTHYLAPLLVALAAPIVLREARRPATGAAVTLALAGLLVLLGPWQNAAGSGPPIFPGALWGAVSALFFAAGVLFNKHLSQRFGPAELIVYHMPSALIVLALLVPAGAWVISSRALGWLVAGAIGPGALAGVVFVRALSQVPAARASVLTFIEPLTAVTIATLLWEQPCGAHSLLGGGAILAAGYWVMRERPAVYAAPSSARA